MVLFCIPLCKAGGLMDTFNNLPLYMQIKVLIEEDVKKNVLKVGEQLPSEHELMLKYGVGRATIRKAIEILESEKVIIKKRGIGTFVNQRIKSLGFEPFLSWSFATDGIGLKTKNMVIEKKILELTDDLKEKTRLLTEGESFYMLRHRTVEDTYIAIEKSYFLKSFSEKIEPYNLEGSLAKIFIEEFNTDISKVEQIIEKRLGNSEEISVLKLKNNQEVLELKRWIYVENNDIPFYYVEFVLSVEYYKQIVR